MKLEHLKIDKSWTLFLDRDGVINKRLPGAYVGSVQEFEFLEGSVEAIKIFSMVFGTIVVVTNQQGIGKGLMTGYELETVHNHMIQEINNSGGRIDKVYHSPFLKSSNHITRKPSVGMGLMAKKDFQDIKFKKSIMVGDSLTDMIFGKRLKMKTVFIGDPINARLNENLIDFVFPDLLTFARQTVLNPTNA
jgi:histidinol-phosphate phosphatase family protein